MILRVTTLSISIEYHYYETIMLSAAFLYSYAECRHAENRYAE